MADYFIDNVIMLTNSFAHSQQINASNGEMGMSKDWTSN